MKIKELIIRYLRYLKALGRSPYTIRGAKSALKRFARYLKDERIINVEGLTMDVLSGYREDLAFYLNARCKPLTSRTQGYLLGAVKGFTRYLKESDYLVHDPGKHIKLPKKPKRLPKVILSPEEIKKLMNAPDARTVRGFRNRVVLEILYDTAIRRAEMANVKVGDMDLESGYILIHGKGDKERVVPLGKKVCSLVKSYVLAVRPRMVVGRDPGYLILNRWGDKMDPNSIWAIVKRCVFLAGLNKKASTHTLRHTCATHMLKRGAPIRYLQEMLGHESLESTQLYTRVTINDLKEVHAKYHPSNKE